MNPDLDVFSNASYLGWEALFWGKRSFQSMVPTGEKSSHQPEGTKSNSFWIVTHCEGSPQQSSNGMCGRHNSISIYKAPRGNSLILPLRDSQKSPALGRSEPDPDVDMVHSRKVQRLSGQAQLSQANPPCRVDSGPSGMLRPVEVMGRIDGGFVCNFQEPLSSPVLLTVCRSSSLGDRCDDAELVQPGRVCLPSVQDGKGGPEEAPVAPEHQDDIDSSLLAKERMVPGAT